jgi:SAM-dependent methyltransferase
VAPGTGQATRSLAERGWAVTAVEHGEKLAQVARRQLASHPDVEIVVSSFEDWELPAEPFDLFVCATAFHWLDPSTRVARAASTLRIGGTAAIIGTHHVAGGSQEFFELSQHCFERFDPATPKDLRLPPEDAIEPATSEFSASRLFTDVEDRRFAVDLAYTADTYTDLLRTYSPVLALPAHRRDGLLDCIGRLIHESFDDRITKRYLFELVLARRTAEAPDVGGAN